MALKITNNINVLIKVSRSKHLVDPETHLVDPETLANILLFPFSAGSLPQPTVVQEHSYAVLEACPEG